MVPVGAMASRWLLRMPCAAMPSWMSFGVLVAIQMGWMNAVITDEFGLAEEFFLKGIGLHTIAIHNSVPSRGPLAPANPWMSRLKWRIGAMAFWSCAEMLYKVTGGRMVWAPSFELIARRSERLS